MRKHGRYIVVEGIDGSGKTTQFNHLLAHFATKAIGVREPGGTPMGENLRAIIKNKELPRSPHTNMFLFAAARADVIGSVIQPAILSGKHVISDRNWLSSVAYQSAEGVPTADIIQLNRMATGSFSEPDILIFIDLDPNTCAQRATNRGNTTADYFDSKGIEYFTKVRNAYIQHVTAAKNGIVVSGKGTPEDVWQRIKTILHERNIT